MNANRLGSLAVLLAFCLALAAAAPAREKPKPPAEKPPAAEKKVAVMGLNNRARITDDEVEYLTDLVRGSASRALAGRGFLVLTRENIYELLPPGKHMADCASATCEVETGRMIGADYIVTGEVLRFAGELRIIMKAHHSFSGAFLGEQTARGKTLASLEDTVKQEADALAGLILAHDNGTLGMPVARAPGAAAAAEKAAPASKKDKKGKKDKRAQEAAAADASAPPPAGALDRKDVHALTNAQLATVVTENADPRTRSAAIRELIGRRDPASLPALQKAAEKDADAGVRGEALAALERTNGVGESRDTVLRAMGDADPAVRLAACRIAGRHRLAGATARLCQLLDDPDRRVQTAALDEIEGLKSPDTVDCVAAMFQKAPDDAARLHALKALRRIGGKRAAASLAKALPNSDERVQREILVVLRDLRDPSVVPQLESLRDQTSDRRLKKMLAETIAHLKKRAR